MAVDRKTPTSAIDGPIMDGPTAFDKINEEVVAIWALNGGILASVAGTANAITANCPVAIASYTDGLEVGLIPASNNTTAVTIALNGLAAKAILQADGNPLTDSMLVASRLQSLKYHTASNAFRMNGSGAGGTTQSAGAVVVANAPANGTAGGGATAGSYFDYPFTTVLQNDLSGEGAALASNTITLPAGTYDVFSHVPFYLTGLSRLRLQNVTDSTTYTSVSSTTSRQVTTNEMHSAGLIGRITLNATKNIKLQARVGTTRATDGLGQPASFTEVERYGVLVFVRQPGSQITLGNIASRNLTVSTLAPSGGADGDLWFRYL